MKYEMGQKLKINLSELSVQDSDLTFVDLCFSNDNIILYNDIGELCCVDGEKCVIDHVVVSSTPRGSLYDLRNDNGDTVAHFMLTEKDLDIVSFLEKKGVERDERKRNDREL